MSRAAATLPREASKTKPCPPHDMDEKLHQIVQGRTPLVWEGVVPPAHVELLLALGWALDGSPRQWSRRHWSVGLRGERGSLEVHQRSGQLAGGQLLLRGRQPQHLDWREVEAALRREGLTSTEDRCEPVGRVVEAPGGRLALELAPSLSNITDGGVIKPRVGMMCSSTPLAFSGAGNRRAPTVTHGPTCGPQGQVRRPGNEDEQTMTQGALP